MNNIKKILREQEEDKDITSVIERLIKSFMELEDPDEKYVCGFGVSNPKFQGKFKYIVMVYFNSGPNSRNWPRTQAVKMREEAILNEMQDYILGFLDVYVQMWSKTTEC